MEKCNNCGQVLTAENIRLALEDAGEDADAILSEESRGDGTNWTATKLDHYRFCCPSYGEHDHEDGKYESCLGYGSEDRELAAYWRTN